MPDWADPAVTVVQLLILAGVLVLAWLARGRLAAGIALAALAPVAFLLTNRIFSSQFLVVLLVAWAIAIALLARSRLEQLAARSGRSRGEPPQRVRLPVRAARPVRDLGARVGADVRRRARAHGLVAPDCRARPRLR